VAQHKLFGRAEHPLGPQPHFDAIYISERKSGDRALLDGPLEAWLMHAQ